MYFTNSISVLCLLLFSLDINASLNFNEKAVLFIKFLNYERKSSFSTEKSHISSTKFLRAQLDRFQSTGDSSECNILSFTKRVIYLIVSQCFFLLEISDLSIIQA